MAASEPRLSYAQLLVAAKDALATGHADAAATLGADACRIDPNRTEAYLVLGQALAQNDHVAASSDAFEHARAKGCREAELFMALASNYDVEHRYKEAVAVYLDYLSDHPHDASMRDELGLTYLLLGDTAQATSQLRRALRDAPSSLQVRQDLGYAWLAARAFSEAEAELSEVCRAPDAAPEAKRLLAQALAGQRKYIDALQVVDTVLDAHPLDRDAQALRTQLLAKTQALASEPMSESQTKHHPKPTSESKAQAQDTTQDEVQPPTPP